MKIYPRNPLAVIAGLMAMHASVTFAAPKTDIVIFDNGDKLTGEVRSLKRGRLALNTDATGTINIEWDKIAQIVSDQHIQIEMSSGALYFGQLIESPEANRIVVMTNDGPQMLDSSRVILMDPIEETAIEALNVDVSVGYNFAKANSNKQVNFGIDADYRTQLRIYSFKASTNITDSSNQDANERQNLTVQYTRLWGDRWNTNGTLTFDKNDELGLILRSSLGASGGRFLIQSNSMLLRLDAGLQFSRENLKAEVDDKDSIEATLTASYDWFRFDNPELDWSTTMQLIPSITESDRVRAEFDTALKWEIIGDLNWGLTFWTSYDSKPQSGAANATVDYGWNTNLVYEF